MAGEKEPGEAGKAGPGTERQHDVSRDDLERRRQKLEASLAAKLHDESKKGDGAGSSSAAGFAQALRLSSEFIAGIVVGVGLGWFVDRFAGTSPWGLIVFLLLGFGAGVLNVLRSAGLVSQAGIRAKDPDDSQNGLR